MCSASNRSTTRSAGAYRDAADRLDLTASPDDVAAMWREVARRSRPTLRVRPEVGAESPFWSGRKSQMVWLEDLSLPEDLCRRLAAWAAIACLEEGHEDEGRELIALAQQSLGDRFVLVDDQ